jgi:hypothetical protein
MSRKRRPKPLPSLDEQLRVHDADAPPGPTAYDGDLQAPSSERVAWVRRWVELADAILKRDGKRLADPGVDASGRYGISPYAAQGNTIEDAPRELKGSKDAGFPKRITTQRQIDRYPTLPGLANDRQWKAGDQLWQIWFESGKGPRSVAGYSQTFVVSAIPRPLSSDDLARLRSGKLRWWRSEYAMRASFTSWL